MVPFEDVDVYLPIGQEDEPDVLASRKLQIARIRNVWEKVPPEDRLLLEQKYILGWSDEMLAAGLDVKPQSVRMYLTRVKRRTTKLMLEEGICMEDWI